MDVLIFKTSVQTQLQASRVHPLLSAMADIKQYNFDLEDCDKILRIVSWGIEPQTITHLLHIAGFKCEELAY
jgi:Ran GTPase-activating protein (RanGAP) involved in mRNA processing and transport